MVRGVSACTRTARELINVHDLSLAACGHDSSTVAEGSPTEGARNENSGIHGGGVRGIVGRQVRTRDTWGQYLLCLIDQGLMAGCSWQCTCG